MTQFPDAMSATTMSAPERTDFNAAGEDELNPFTSMLARYERAAELVDLDPGIDRILRHPEREITVAVPVVMDNGETRVFTGYRVVHNTARGPGKGGIRFDAAVSRDE